jgi:hypothetical protein
MQRKPRFWMILVAGVLQFSARAAFAQDEVDEDHSLTLEIGSAAGWDLNGSSSQFGGTLAVEVTPIEHWLELESGITALHASDHTEVGIDFLFKKPYRLSRTAEFMIGAGPELVRKFGDKVQGTSFDVEAVLDFMFWPSNNVGWYLEPSYSFVPGKSEEQSLGATAGLLIGWQ